MEGLMLKLQYFEHLMLKAKSLEKALMMGKTVAKREGASENEMVHGITDSMDMSLSKLKEIVKARKPDKLQSM